MKQFPGKHPFLIPEFLNFPQKNTLHPIKKLDTIKVALKEP